MQQLPTNLANQRKTGCVSSANACWAFINFLLPHPAAGTWPIYITTPGNLIPHAPEQMKLFLPETPAWLLTLHSFTTSSDSGALAETICLSVNVEKRNMPIEHTKAWKSALGCRQSLRCWEVINRHQTTAQASSGKWGKRYSPVTRCSKSKSHSLSFSSIIESGLMHSGIPLPGPFCRSYRLGSHCCTKKTELQLPISSWGQQTVDNNKEHIFQTNWNMMIFRVWLRKADPYDSGAALDDLLRCLAALFPMTRLAKLHLLDSICGKDRSCIPRYYTQYYWPVNLLFT